MSRRLESPEDRDRIYSPSCASAHPPMAKCNAHDELALSDEGSEARTAKSEVGGAQLREREGRGLWGGYKDQVTFFSQLSWTERRPPQVTCTGEVDTERLSSDHQEQKDDSKQDGNKRVCPRRRQRVKGREKPLIQEPAEKTPELN